ncbi:TRAP transporter small permease [Pseudoruegeria sp. HB172150]|uniref:TRAP transporter small permease n=1 Tax=Pseudoruegeria sp. HB172150 TaxID=2721164 RepID=UPI0015565EE1|nr:TRAP transporter small permease subunit [Pseudoruegeria sp. HB172150]
MRTFLDRLYSASLMLSAVAFACIALLVLAQILGRLTDRFARWIGAAPPGFTVPSLAEIGGFLFLSAVFMGLAGTLTAGGHVRVTLLTRKLPDGPARWTSTLVSLGATGIAVFATWSSAIQAWDSWAFGSVSYGMVKVPLWLPQGFMTLGLALLTVAVIDAAITQFKGGIPPHLQAEADREAGH